MTYSFKTTTRDLSRKVVIWKGCEFLLFNRLILYTALSKFNSNRTAQDCSWNMQMILNRNKYCTLYILKIGPVQLTRWNGFLSGIWAVHKIKVSVLEVLLYLLIELLKSSNATWKYWNYFWITVFLFLSTIIKLSD